MKTKTKTVIWAVSFALFFVAYIFFLVKFTQDTGVYHLYKSSGTANVGYEKALVLAVLNQDIEPDSEYKEILSGTQNLKVRILTGPRKGTEKEIQNVLNYTTTVIAKPGDVMILHIDSADQNHWLATIYSPDRAPYLFLLLLIFIAALSFIGGWRGIKSVAGILFTFFSLVFLFIPLLYRGYSPILSAFIMVMLTSFVCLYLLNGPCGKTFSAILGTLIGVALAAIVAGIFQSITQISGLNDSEADSLLAIGGKTGLKVGELLFASLLIASLGAVMDIAISVASAVEEVYKSNPGLERKKLFSAGMNVGKDTMGTMANTLILAFVGSSLNLLILIYSLQNNFNQIANSNMVAIEVIKALSGSLGVVLTVPAVAFISAVLIPLGHKKLSS